MTSIIRRYRPEDAGPLAELFFHSVHDGTAHAYTAEERSAWAPRPPRGADWARRLAQSVTLVAEASDGDRGFMSLTRAGHLDLAFVLPGAMGSGLAARLYRAIETEAALLGLAQLSTEASHPARGFFVKQGWEILARLQVERNGIDLVNFRMEKRLH